MVTSTQSTYYYTTTTSTWSSSMGPTATGTVIYYYGRPFPRDSAAVRRKEKIINKTRANLMPAGELFEM